MVLVGLEALPKQEKKKGKGSFSIGG